MNKKSLVQLFLSLIFFGITAYVMYGFFTGDKAITKSQAVDGKSAASTLNIKSLLNRNFQTEQVDIFEKEAFIKLKDNSVEIADPKKTKIGKDNPFSPIK